MYMKTPGEQHAIGRSIAAEGYIDGRSHLTDSAYELVADVVPIMCVDVIPVDVSSSGVFRLGTIIRGTGSERGKLAIVGGRLQKNEGIEAAISRHLNASFDSPDFEFYDGNTEDTPFYLAQYKHAPHSEAGYDPTKHAIAPTYLITIDEPTSTRDEALSFQWIGLDEIPSVTAYNHGIALQRAADFLLENS